MTPDPREALADKIAVIADRIGFRRGYSSSDRRMDSEDLYEIVGILRRAALAATAAPTAPCPDGDACPDAHRHGAIHPAPAATAAQAQGAEPPPGHYTNAMKVAPEPPIAWDGNPDTAADATEAMCQAPAALQDRLRKADTHMLTATALSGVDLIGIANLLREAADALDRLTAEIAEAQQIAFERGSGARKAQAALAHAEAQADALRACVKAADAMRGEGYEPRPSVAKVQAYDAARAQVGEP